MPTDNLLLYILPDLAYIARLVPSKKEHNFSVSEFRQINGEFLDDNVLLEKNLDKLLSKLEKGSYRLILPDFLFTSTIVNIEAKTQNEVKDYLKNELLPSLNLDEENFYLDTTILSNYKGSFKVQLTALEKALLTPLSDLLKEKNEIKIESISPLNWTSKALISLEPSVAILQLGNNLYLAEHYIGVDQCFYSSVTESSNFAETIKTLKGAEPSLQTVYLLTNSLVDGQLKEALKDTLPVQQIADLASENEKMPSYIKQIIEAAAKTFSIPEYLLPQFKLDGSYDKKLEVGAMETENEEEEEKTAEVSESLLAEDIDLIESLVKPAVVGMAASNLPKPEALTEEKPVVVSESEEVLEKTEKLSITPEGMSKTTSIAGIKEETVKKDTETAEIGEEITNKKEINLTPVNKLIKPDDEEKHPVESKEIDLSQFANLAIDPSVIDKKKIEANKDSMSKDNKSEMITAPTKKVIKNQSEAGGVAKMIFIGLLSFIVTIAIGVGLGLAYINYTDQSPTAEQPSTEPTASPTATPTPTPALVIDKAEYSLLVVNATGRAGYAGTVASDIENAGFPTVAAANASGDYESSDYLLVKTDDEQAQALLKELETATDLDLEISTEIAEEDSAGNYDAVLVLAK